MYIAQRRIRLVNREVQGRIIVFALVSSSLSALVAMYGYHYVVLRLEAGQTPTLTLYALPLLMLAALLITITLVGIFMSNQIAGPIFRVHQNLKTMRNGNEKASPIKLRKGDCYHDLIEDLNQLNND